MGGRVEGVVAAKTYPTFLSSSLLSFDLPLPFTPPCFLLLCSVLLNVFQSINVRTGKSFFQTKYHFSKFTFFFHATKDSSSIFNVYPNHHFVPVATLLSGVFTFPSLSFVPGKSS